MESIRHIRNKLKSQSFIDKHKASIAAFTRVRKLTFATMFILILRNSVKSLQLMLNEFSLDKAKDLSITAGAFTKARKKLKHTAYVELNGRIGYSTALFLKKHAFLKISPHHKISLTTTMSTLTHKAVSPFVFSA